MLFQYENMEKLIKIIIGIGIGFILRTKYNALKRNGEYINTEGIDQSHNKYQKIQYFK